MAINMGHGKHWLRPPTVEAPSPDNRTKTVGYKISEQYMYALQGISRLGPIFQLWAHVVGDLPPINNISPLNRGLVKPTLTTLADSVACFRGVNWPYDDEGNGDSVLVYVLNPAVTIIREADLVCLAKSAKVPPNTALTVQVKPIKSTDGADLHGANKALHVGVVTRLEFVPAEAGSPALPVDHARRYTLRLW